MTAIVKIHRKGQMTLPTKLRRLAGISEGDLVQASFQRGKIVITPAVVIDRSQFPNADDDYTPAQRRAIDARLAESEEAGEMIAHMKAELKKRTDAKRTKRTA